MQLQQMRYVIAAAEFKNFSAAAKSLYISQPSLSQQISNLERELGIPLFIRHAKSVTTTDAGEHFVRQAKRILNQTEQLTELMKKFSMLQSGTIKIGMLWIAGYLDLPDIVTDFHKQYPGVTCRLQIDGSNTLLHKLTTMEISAAFIINDGQIERQPEFYARKLMDDNYMAVMSRHHPLAQRREIALSDLDGETIIMPSEKSAFRKDLEHRFGAADVHPKLLCETSQSDIVMQLAGAGLAIGFSSSSIAEKLKGPDCCILPLKEKLSRPVYYVTLKEFLDYPSVRSFTDFVESRFA